ncbi:MULTISPECIES: complement resistance protein TraT [Enterobacter]|uniref:complement resistance protein TraT n=1 Tax=Enterobacter TaxID=547 RepID=UPI0021CE194C|nr:complement resistance protein TraT [Enterobacter quasiroggenkampii]MCU6359198.1 complement resistance protein TraT [Enterobacter quasiroggenkampii]
MTLTGCGAMTTAVKKRNLEVKTQMSETIWLEPSSEKTVYIQVKNTSDKDMSNLQTLLANDLSAKGYKVTSSPDSAYYWVQANVLKADKMDLRESQGYLKTGYEGAAVGAALGAGITAYNSNSSGAARGAGCGADRHGDRAKYQTRVVSNANKVNLKFEEAKPVLEAQLAKSVANIL